MSIFCFGISFYLIFTCSFDHFNEKSKYFFTFSLYSFSIYFVIYVCIFLTKWNNIKLPPIELAQFIGNCSRSSRFWVDICVLWTNSKEYDEPNWFFEGMKHFLNLKIYLNKTHRRNSYKKAKMGKVKLKRQKLGKYR